MRSNDAQDRRAKRGGLGRRHPGRAGGWARLATAIAASALAGGVLAGPALGAGTPPDVSGNYMFQTLDNSNDLTFNQLLGINNEGLIAGYFGSGMTGHANKGYTLRHGSYMNENFPGSAQTQVTGLNNDHITVGFWLDRQGNSNGFYRLRGKFHRVDYPSGGSPTDQLLGVNDGNKAVGFYTTGSGATVSAHGFTYNIAKKRLRKVNVPGDTNITAAAINNLGDVAGFATNSAGNTEAFVLRSDGRVLRLTFPGAASTQAFGVNDGDEVVGDYTVGTGSRAATEGFVWAPGFGFQVVNDPNGIGATTINGVNDRGTLVGFYTDSSGNTDGLLARSNLGM